MERCSWVSEEPIYIKYHDEEWGIPCHEDQVLFEFLVLESAQAGLSWITILKRREGYRKAFDNFDPNKVALYDEQKVEQLLQDPGIIRNRLKVVAAINNANRFLEVQKEYGSFNNYLWGFVDHQQITTNYEKLADVPVSNELSDRLTKDLKKRGFKFLGTTIVYSYLQATGVVNDHTVNCFCHK